MARFYGKIGFAEQKEVKPDVWKDVIVERPYVGSFVRNTIRWNQGSEINDDVRLDEAVSIISDPYILQHSAVIRYVDWQGTKWKIMSIQINYPRVILQLAGEYHGQNSAKSQH